MSDPSPASGGRRAAAKTFVLDVPSDLQAVEPTVARLVRLCRQHSFAESRLSLNFRVGVTEALANAILYGNGIDAGKLVRISLCFDDAAVTVRVEDEGCGFDPDAVPDPTLPENLQRSGGRGVFLIRQLMDEVEYADCGNAVKLVLYRDPPGEHPSP